MSKGKDYEDDNSRLVTTSPSESQSSISTAQIQHSQEDTELTETDVEDTDVEDTTTIHPAERAQTEGSHNKNAPLCRTGKALIMFKVN
jgi:hypothetical protein